MSGKHSSEPSNRAIWISIRLVTSIVVLLGILFATYEVGAKPGDPPPPAAIVPIKGVDPEAAGINEGKKKQAISVKMRNNPKIDADEVVGKSGPQGGCVKGYGRGRQCLPPISPQAVQHGMTRDQHPWNCIDLRTILPQGINVNKKGDDPLRLDFNQDGIACGRGD